MFISHRLIESVRTPRGPRQRVVINHRKADSIDSIEGHLFMQKQGHNETPLLEITPPTAPVGIPAQQAYQSVQQDIRG